MSRNWVMPASAARNRMTRRRKRRFSTAARRSPGTSASTFSAAIRSGSKLSLPPRSRFGARYRSFNQPVSPNRFPNPPCPLLSNGLSTSPRCSGPCAYHAATFQGEGIAAPRYRYRVVLIDPVWSSWVLPAEGHHPPLQYRRRRAFQPAFRCFRRNHAHTCHHTIRDRYWKVLLDTRLSRFRRRGLRHLPRPGGWRGFLRVLAGQREVA